MRTRCSADPDGLFRPVRAKSTRSQEVRALLVTPKQLLGRLIDGHIDPIPDSLTRSL